MVPALQGGAARAVMATGAPEGSLDRLQGSRRRFPVKTV